MRLARESLLALVSPERRQAEELQTRRVSTAVGSKIQRLPKSAYLRDAATSAAAPASIAAALTYDSARVQMTVTSQHIDLLLCLGTSVRPSGRFLSVRNNPEGSFVTGIPAEAKERAIRSLRASWCMADLPGALLHSFWMPNFYITFLQQIITRAQQ